MTTPRVTARLRGVHVTSAEVSLVRTALAMVGPAEGTKISQRQIQLSLLNRSTNAQVVEAYDINLCSLR